MMCGNNPNIIQVILTICSQLKEDSSISYTKMFLLKSLSLLLSTAEFENKSKTTFVLNNNEQELAMIGEVSSLLIKTCQSGEQMQISYALNAFYDIYSESFYDEILKEQ